MVLTLAKVEQSMASAAKRYPAVPAKHWWALRVRFRQANPVSVTPSYLATVLETQENSAKSKNPPRAQGRRPRRAPVISTKLKCSSGCRRFGGHHGDAFWHHVPSVRVFDLTTQKTEFRHAASDAWRQLDEGARYRLL